MVVVVVMQRRNLNCIIFLLFQFFLKKWKIVFQTVVLILRLLALILSVTDLIAKIIVVLHLKFIVKNPTVFIVIILTNNSWVNTGDVLLKTVNSCIHTRKVDIVVFVVKCIIFLLNCRKLIFFNRILFVDLHLMINLYSL